MVEHLIVSYREEVAVQSGRTGRDNLKLVGRLYYKEDLLQALHTRSYRRYHNAVSLL